MIDEVPMNGPTFTRDQVADLATRLSALLTDPSIELTPEERQEWERVLATAVRLADGFDVPK